MNYLKATTPLNIAEEKEKFFSQAHYSPQFVYRWDAMSVQKYKAETPELSALVDALVGQDDAVIANEASRYFDVAFRQEDIALAKQLTATTPTVANETAEEVAKALKQALAEMDIDYRVEVVDRHGFQCRPNHKARVISISQHLHLQFSSAEGVASHELVHIIRAVNGQYNNISRVPNYLPTEEGLCCLVQDRFFKEPTGSTFQHALEYLAAHLSQTAGFREVYDFLRAHGCDAQNAWLRGIRQKFGLCDTSRPGGLLRSGMYFYHEQLVRELTSDELLRLFVGKIPQHKLAAYPAYSGQVSEQKLRQFLR